ncbi:hypothetical protein MEL_287 [Melbournevirus]|uniref:hypothetical protein n=1 Tax=Melbournevirus TaxID=1560514 RepID=UPI00051F59F6|nr:hypothetical protein MEL_287 [Melbournevirus]AIT54900.1 hypothetical protein MEL_287 [Melbournevirus]
MDIVCSCGEVCEQDKIHDHLREHQERMEFLSEVPEEKAFYCGPCSLLTKNLLSFKRHIAKRSHEAAVTYARILKITKDESIARRELFSMHDRKVAARFMEREQFRQIGIIFDHMRPANILNETQ